MTRIGILRSGHNERKCPLTNCFNCLNKGIQGFEGYEGASPAGVFTMSGSADDTLQLAGIMKAKGAEAVHIVTCAFARKEKEGWILDDDSLAAAESLARRIASEAGISCVLGTAHLPAGFSPRRFEAGT